MLRGNVLSRGAATPAARCRCGVGLRLQALFQSTSSSWSVTLGISTELGERIKAVWEHMIDTLILSLPSVWNSPVTFLQFLKTETGKTLHLLQSPPWNHPDCYRGQCVFKSLSKKYFSKVSTFCWTAQVLRLRNLCYSFWCSGFWLWTTHPLFCLGPGEYSSCKLGYSFYSPTYLYWLSLPWSHTVKYNVSQLLCQIASVRAG